MDTLTLYEKHRRNEGALAETTLSQYVYFLRRCPEYVAEPTVENYLGVMEAQAHQKSSSRRVWGRALKDYARWHYADERNPIDGVKLPRDVLAPPGRVATDEAIDAVLKVYGSKTFTHRRNRAIIITMRDTGVRRSEICRMRVEDLDFDEMEIRIVEPKNTRGRVVPMTSAMTTALWRYAQERDEHHLAHLDALWIGGQGPLLPNSVSHILAKGAEEAGVELTPHQLRRAFAWKMGKGGATDDVTAFIGGWKSTAMVHRYRREMLAELAHEQHRAIFDPPKKPRRITRR